MKKRVGVVVLGGFAALLMQAGCSRADGPGQNAVAPETSTSAPNRGPTALTPARPAAGSVTLPEGAPLVVRTTSALSTNTQQAGQTFRAHLEQPLVLDGREVVPKGTEAEGTIVESDKGGRVTGRATLAVRMTRLFTGGHTVEISTGSLRREANASKAKDAAKIGIGGGIGAAIGAVAGGGTGAAIGAAAGAGAGTGVVLATYGDPAVIPGEAVLHFVLRTPVTVAGSRLERPSR